MECIEVAKGLKYTPPANKTFECYTFEEVCNLSIHEVLKSHVLVYAAVLICERYSLAKVLFKSSLKEYISIYGGPHMIPGHKMKNRG